MAGIYFEDLEIWKLARVLTKKIYELTNMNEFSRDFGLRDQIRRAAISVMSNIAEGFERGGNQEFYQFLSIAKSSCGEARCQLYIAKDQKYVDEINCEILLNDFKKLSIMINKFMSYLKKSPQKGHKYK
ncbi:MAG: four helix bundle protein [Nitrospirota bacterium]|nr:four helix bundle protein [Nitrospirota bacterium]